MTFRKPFLCCDNDDVRIRVQPDFTETQKLGLEHGFWSYSIQYLKSRKQKTKDKNQRKWNNILNRGSQTKESSTPVCHEKEK